MKNTTECWLLPIIDSRFRKHAEYGYWELELEQFIQQ